MDLSSEFYKRIIYRKNAINELASYIKFYHKHKSILYLTNNSNENSGQILAQIASSGNSFKFCQVNSLSINDIHILYEKAKECKLIIAFCDNELANLTKYISKANDADYCLIPIGPISPLMFTPYYLSPISKLNCYKTKMPTRIFIDETILLNCDRARVLDGYEMYLAYFEYYFCTLFENKMKNDDDLFLFSKVLSRFEEVFSLYKAQEKDANLVLMDNLIELADITKEIPLNQLSFINFASLLKNNGFLQDESLSYERYCLMASDMLLVAYRQILMQKKIKKLNIPNYDEIASLLEKYNVSGKYLKGANFFEKLLTEELLSRFNDKKDNMLGILDDIREKFKVHTKSITLIRNSVITTNNLGPCYDSLKILPFIFENNQLLDVVGGSGILNF